MQKMYDFLTPFTKCGTPITEVENFFSIFVDAPRTTETAEKVIKSRKANLERFIRKNVGNFGAIVVPDEATIATMRKVISDYNRADANGKEYLRKDAFIASGVCWLLGNLDLMTLLRPKLRSSSKDTKKPERPRLGNRGPINAPHTDHNVLEPTSTSFFARKVEGKTMKSYTSAPNPNGQKFSTVKKGYKGRWRSKKDIKAADDQNNK